MFSDLLDLKIDVSDSASQTSFCENLHELALSNLIVNDCFPNLFEESNDLGVSRDNPFASQ